MSPPEDARATTSSRRHALAVGILCASLWSTFTNLVALSVGYVVLAPVIPWAFIRNRAIPRGVWAMTALYGYFLLSTLFYAPRSILQPEFYRRDGNFFITFLPVLIGAVLGLPIDVERLLRSFLKWITFVNAAFLAVFFATGGTIFLHDRGVYHFLFLAHNAAGGYLASITALALGLYLGRGKTPVALLIVAVNAFGMLLTISRGSVLGLLMAVIVVVVLRERFTKTILVTTAVALGIAMYYLHRAWVAAGEPAGLYSGEETIGSDIEAREVTIFDRVFFLWPRAVDLFIKSPIFGTGFGSYNDVPYHLVGIPGLIMYNEPSSLIFSAAHAHNTYLHVLAENGLLGLALLGLALREIWRFIKTIEPRSVQLALNLAFWTAIFASLTEHRLFTPSEMLPFTIFYGIALARRNAEERRAGVFEISRSAPEPPQLKA